MNYNMVISMTNPPEVTYYDYFDRCYLHEVASFQGGLNKCTLKC